MGYGPMLPKSGATVRHKSLQQQYIPPQPFLVRSNSTPAIFSSIPSRTVLYSGQQSPHQQHGSSLFSPAPQRVAPLGSFPKTLGTSTDSAHSSVAFLHPHDTPSEMPGHPLDMAHSTLNRSSATQQPYGNIDPSSQESVHFYVKEEDSYADGQNRLQAVPAQVQQQYENVNMEEHRHIADSERSSDPSTSNQIYRQLYTTPFQQPGAIESERRGQLQQLKTEQMDDNEAFDSSLAMVLDDHLSLMDHLDMMPEIQVYREMPLTSSIQHPFHGPDLSRNRTLGAGYCSETTPGTNSVAYFSDLAHGPSDMAAVKQEEFPEEDPMLYFDGISSSSSQGHEPVAASQPDAVTPASNTPVASSMVHEKGCSTPPSSFGYMQGDCQQIKMEPSFPQIQRAPQHYAEPSYHPLEQQHPLDMGSMDTAHRTMIAHGISNTATCFSSRAQLPQHQQQYS
ncbi:hypothetical protein BGZ68_007565 [Mortierella alpina]|nr:hypothetical protein BGZ68_007565 [Mortierella alpina]